MEVVSRSRNLTQVEVRRVVLMRDHPALPPKPPRVGWSEDAQQIAHCVLPSQHHERKVASCVHMSKDGDQGQPSQEQQLPAQILAGRLQRRGPGQDPGVCAG